MVVHRGAGQEYGLWRYAVLYSELRARLEALRDAYPGWLRVDSIGRSHEGRDIFLVTVAEDVTDEGMRRYERQRQQLLWHPREAPAGKLPVLINCNLHGSEISGTDGMLSLLEELLGSGLREVLRHTTLFITICMNPDGRARGFDILNAHAVDLNRDWMTQSQPETRAVVQGVLTRFYPAVMVDMHGFMASGNILIDACTPPHNPFVEYDLLGPHLLANSQAMAAVIGERLGLGVDIPALQWTDGWEDYSPIYTAVFFLCYGAIAHTVETNFPSEEGATATHCAAVGTLRYVQEHAAELDRGQREFFARGLEMRALDRPAPAFYRIPLEGQRDGNVVRDSVNAALRNGVRVYTDAGGNYVIPCAQPLRPVIHNMFWSGEDTSELVDACYDVSFYSLPVMRGFVVEELAACDGELTPVVEPLPLGAPTVLRQRSPRILAVADSGTLDEVLGAWGYDARFLPFSELNRGYRVRVEDYDLLVAGGTEMALWNDPFDELLGVGYGTSWALRERGRAELLRAAQGIGKRVLYGFAGQRINEALGLFDATPTPMLPPQNVLDAEGPKDWMLSVPNGSFRLRLDTADPLCAGYREEELFYLVAPLSFAAVRGAATPIRFAEQDSFVHGFNKRKGETDGQIAAMHGAGNVLLGFDPTFRRYTDVSFGILRNAIALC